MQCGCSTRFRSDRARGIALPQGTGTSGYRTGLAVILGPGADGVAGYANGLVLAAGGAPVIGPWLVCAEEVATPDALIGDGVPIAAVVAAVARRHALYPGDVILAGLREAPGAVGPGDTIACGIAALGEMEVKVRAA